MTKQNKVVRYKRPFTINLGTTLFLIVFIYIVVQVFLYFNTDHYAIYEVLDSTISDEEIFDGFILRDEIVYNTNNGGYINYYVGEGDRVAKNAPVYSIDETGEMYKLLANSNVEETMTEEDIKELRASVSSFRKEYSDSNYSAVYSFKDDMQNTVLQLMNANMSDVLETINKKFKSGSSFQIVNAEQSGIVSYVTDGFEEASLKNIDDKWFDSTDYQKQYLRTAEEKKEKNAVYKLIKSDNWNIVVKLTKNQYDKLNEKKNVKVTFLQDGLEMKSYVETVKQGDLYYGILTFDKYMLRFMNSRYVSLKLTFDSASGLKIPKSSIIKEEFYKIPSKYITVGGSSNTTGVYKQYYNEKGVATPEFVNVTIYSKDGEMAYIEKDSLEVGDTILLTDESTSSEKEYTISETASLDGVYNVNKGYSVFRKVEVIYENDEYCIVDPSTKYGLSNYDHIILNGNSVN